MLDPIRLLNDPKVVEKTPLLTVFLLEGANVGQITRMWQEQTAAGQSLTSWLLVLGALLAWAQFYKVCIPEQLWARRATLFGIGMNLLVILSVLYFRYGV